MLERLLTEQRNPASAHIDSLPTLQMLEVINAEDRKVADAVASALPSIAAAVDATAGALAKGGRLFYIGAGTSGRLGVLDASECPPTFSVQPELVQGIIAGGESALVRATEASEDDAESGARDLLARGFGEKDVVFGIAASGRTPYVLGAVRRARQLGALTGSVSCVPGAELSAVVDLAIEVPVGPEILTGSTRMKAGTATKLVLNMLSTGTMIRLGYVFSNLMVNVKPTNEKLLDRARRIVAEAGLVESQRAAELLAQAGTVRGAILMARLGVDAKRAEKLLEQAGGAVGKVLGYGKTAD